MPEPNATPAPLEAALHSLREIIALRTGPERGNLSPEHIYEQQSMEHHAILTVSGMRLVLAEVESTRAKLAEAEAQRDADRRAHVVSMNAKHEMWEQAIALRDTSAAQLEALWPLLTAAESRVAALTEALMGKNAALMTLVEEGRSYIEWSKQGPFERALDAAEAEAKNPATSPAALYPSQDAKGGA